MLFSRLICGSATPLLLGALLGGCIEASDGNAGPSDVIVGWTNEGTLFNITLQPNNLLRPDASRVSGYSLTISNYPGASDGVRYNVAVAGRVDSIVLPCQERPCYHQDAIWFTADVPAPFFVGSVDLPKGPVPFDENTFPLFWPLSGGKGAIHMEKQPTGATPTRVEQQGKDDVRFEGQLVVDPSIAAPPLTSSPATNRGLVPGMDQDAFRVGFTPADVLTFLESEDEDAAHLMQGGCITRMEFGTATISGMTGGSRDYATIGIRISHAEEPDMSYFVVETDDPLALGKGFVLSGKQESENQMPCEHGREWHSDWVSLQERAKIIGHRGDEPPAFGFDVVYPAISRAIGTETRALLYVMYVPEHVSPGVPALRPYSIHLDASTGHLAALTAHPADVTT